MSSVLCLTVRFLDPVPAFHGRGDGGNSEWPPSPLRIFQALVAAASAKWIGSEFINLAVPALHWLEQQGEPTILVPGIQSQRTGFRMYVPNNATDLVTAKWARGDFAATVAEHRVEKDVLPTRFLTSDTIYFLWELPDILPADFKNILQTLTSVSRSITHLGWGIDMVAANAEILSQEDADKLGGHRWQPVPSGGTPLRIPIEGTLSALKAKHNSFLNRLSDQGFVPVPPLTTFHVVGYSCATVPNSNYTARPFLAFSILKTDDSGFKAFDTVRRTRDVAAMVRCAVANSARQFGWTEDRINSFIHGHGSAKSGQATTDDRLMFLPLPSITPIKVDSIRRVLVVAPQGCSTKKLRNILNGVELIKEGQAEPIAMLTLLPKSDRTVENYTKASSTWSTVTPVLLPGYDDPGHIRKKLKSVNDSDTQKKLLDKLNTRVLQLLQKAFIQAGFSKDLVDQIQFDWRSVGFRSGVDLASKYVRPENLNKFPAYHVFVRFPVNLSGPLAIGAGRYRGFGTFAIHND
jgi:CRISPR-associated protein Csb2